MEPTAVENELNELKLTPNSVDPTGSNLDFDADQIRFQNTSAARQRENRSSSPSSLAMAPLSPVWNDEPFTCGHPKERFPGAETRVVTSLTLSEPTQHSIWSQGVYMAKKSRDLKWSEYVKICKTTITNPKPERGFNGFWDDVQRIPHGPVLCRPGLQNWSAS